jgi:DNA-binding MarR family transcriptional regulator
MKKPYYVYSTFSIQKFLRPKKLTKLALSPPQEACVLMLGGIKSCCFGYNEGTIKEALRHVKKDLLDNAEAAEGANRTGQLQDGEFTVLCQLTEGPTTMTQVDVENATGISRKTVGKHLKALVDRGFVCYSKGKRGGASITQAGRDFLENKS